VSRARSGKPAQSARSVDLAKIHIAATALGMIKPGDRDTYVAMLREVAKVDSAADLDAAGRARVLAHLRSCGWADPSHQKPPESTVRYERGTPAALIRWLWTQLAKAGLVDDSSERALRRYIANHAGLGTPPETITERDPRHLDRKETSQVIEQLKRWLARKDGQA
jgi:phage gp16-like protein